MHAAPHKKFGYAAQLSLMVRNVKFNCFIDKFGRCPMAVSRLVLDKLTKFSAQNLSTNLCVQQDFRLRSREKVTLLGLSKVNEKF